MALAAPSSPGPMRVAAFFWGCASVQAFPTGHASSTRRPLTPPRRQLALYRHHLLPVRPINCRTNGHLAGNRAISVALESVAPLTGGFSGTNKLRKTRQQCPRGGTPPMSAKCNSRRCSRWSTSWEEGRRVRLFHFQDRRGNRRCDTYRLRHIAPRNIPAMKRVLASSGGGSLDGVSLMRKLTIIGLSAAASLSLGAATPALANYGHCSEEPDSRRVPNLQHARPASSTLRRHCASAIVHAHYHHHYAPTERG